MNSTFDFSADFKRIQTDWLARVTNTRASFPNLVKACSDAIVNQWKLKNLLGQELRDTVNEELPANQQLVSIYFGRNAIYLKASFLLAQEGSISPCYDLLRTIYETITRAYLFSLDQESAKLMLKAINESITPLEKKELNETRYFGFDYCSQRLFDKELHNFDKLYRHLCRFSHPSITSANKDWEYSANLVEDCLKMILSLSFGNIQILMEAFSEYVKDRFKDLCRDSLEAIADQLGFTPVFTPDSQLLKPRMEITTDDIRFNGISLF